MPHSQGKGLDIAISEDPLAIPEGEGQKIESRNDPLTLPKGKGQKISSVNEPLTLPKEKDLGWACPPPIGRVKGGKR